jgi:hypothetical protein
MSTVTALIAAINKTDPVRVPAKSLHGFSDTGVKSSSQEFV